MLWIFGAWHLDAALDSLDRQAARNIQSGIELPHSKKSK
jgi:hypothetical protein